MIGDAGGSTDGRADQDGRAGDLRPELLREVNERIEELGGGWEAQSADGILCECGNSDCTETIEIAPAIYERVRGVPTRFLVKPGHAPAGGERIVEQAAGYLVVEKVGHAAETAIQLDPRRRSTTNEHRNGR